MTQGLATMAEGQAPVAQLEAVVVRARPRLEALARRLVWDGEEARDVVQAALADAVGRWPQGLDAAQAEAWLRRVVVNRALSVLRRRKVWRTLEAVLLVTPEPPAGPDEAAERSQHGARLGAALERLPARQGVAFSLRYLEGLSFDEVAEAMGIDRGTVRVHVQRAVRALREQGVLSGDDDGGAA